MDVYQKLGAILTCMKQLKKQMEEGDDGIPIRENYKHKAEYGKSLCEQLGSIFDNCSRRANEQIIRLMDGEERMK